MRFTLFFLTVLAVAVPDRIRAAVGPGARVLAADPPGPDDPPRPPALSPSDGELAAGELGARFFAYWALLDAFHIGGSVRNALLVLAVQVVASVFPFTPGGAGVQQALLLTIFAHSPDVAAFSVGQQIATAVLSSALGFAALVLIFRFRSFREVIVARTRASPSRERPARLRAEPSTRAAPADPRL